MKRIVGFFLVSCFMIICISSISIIGILFGEKPNVGCISFQRGSLMQSTVPGNSDPSGDEWPMFRGALNHTGVAATTPAQDTGPSWSYPTGNGVASSPAISGGRAYVGSLDGNVYCLNATTGAYIWNYFAGNAVESSPALADGCVFVGCYDGSVYCMDATTGAYVWSYTTGSYIISSPAVAGGRVYVGSLDGNVYCLDATTGAYIWNYPTASAVESSPAVADGRVYVGSYDDNVYCLNATTGAYIWNFPTYSYVFSSPAVSNGLVYVGSVDGNVYCLEAATGGYVWYYPTGNSVYSSPAVAGGRVYVGSCDDNVYCLDATTGAYIWNYPTGNYVYSSPAVANGCVYVGSWDNKTYCLNAATSTLLWSYSTSAGIFSSPSLASGHVYIGSLDGNIYCLPMVLIPTAPQNVQAFAGNGLVSLSWQVPVSNGGSGITGYNIYRGTSSGGEVLVATVANVTSYTDMSVTNGQTYYYEVAAFNAAVEGLLSTEASATPAATAYTVLIIQEEDPWGWIIGPQIEPILRDHGIAYTIIDQTQIATVDLSKYARVIISSTSRDFGLTLTVGAYKAKLENYVMNGGTLEIHAASNEVTPWGNGMPFGFVYTTKYSDNLIIMNLSNPIMCIPHTITPRELNGWTYSAEGYLSTMNGTHQVIITDDLGNPVMVIANFGAGMMILTTQTIEYGYGFGVSSFLENMVLYGTPIDFAPASPRSLVSASGFGYVVLSWQVPWNNGGSAITGYNIFRGITTGGETFLASIGNVTTYNDTSVTNGQPYYYKVSAVNAVGVGSLSNENFVILSGTYMKDVLLVHHGSQSTNYLTRNGFTFDTIDESAFAYVSTATLSHYRILILEPDWVDYNDLRNGLATVKTYLDTERMVVGIRVAGICGNQTDIDLLGTDFDHTNLHQAENIIDNNHPFISGVPWSGHLLQTSNFDSWGFTDNGWLTHKPDGQAGYEEVLTNTNGTSMLKYNYDQGFVVVDTLTSLDGGWGMGNANVADNYINYLNYLSTLNTEPSITSPPDVTYVFGATGHSISWTVTDASLGTTSYTIKRNGMAVTSGTWISGTPVSWSVDGLAVGSYNYTIIADDGLGGSVQDEVIVKVLNVAPSITSPPNVIYTLGTIGHAISWTVTDASVGTTSYSIKRNGTQVTSGTWISGTPVSWSADGLPVGSYNYTIIADDGLGGSVQDEVIVTVQNVAPSITSPPDVTYVFGTTGHSISWTVTDASVGTTSYTIKRNGMAVTSGTWISGTPVSWSVDGLPVGSYNYTIIADDGLGGSVQDEVIVTVLNVAPSITSPPDVTYVFGATGHSISWTVTDASVGTTSYTIKRNGTQVASGTWISGTPVSWSVDGLAVGSYNYTIIADDGLGGSVQDEVIVKVLNVAPSITSPPNVIYTLGTIGHAISWTVTDASVGTTSYGIKRNGTQVASGAWTTGVAVSINVDGLAVGSYNFTIIASDGLGGSVKDEVIVTVSSFLPLGLHVFEFVYPVHLIVSINVSIAGNLTIVLFNASSILKSLNMSTSLTAFDLNFTGTASGVINITFYYTGTPSGTIVAYHEIGSKWTSVFLVVNSTQAIVSFSVNSLSRFIIGIVSSQSNPGKPGGNTLFAEFVWFMFVFGLAVTVTVAAVVTVRKNKASRQRHLPKAFIDVVSRNKEEFASRITKTTLPKIAAISPDFTAKSELAPGKPEVSTGNPTRDALLRDLEAFEMAKKKEDVNVIESILARISPVIDEELQRHPVDSIAIIDVIGPAWYKVGVSWERYLDKDVSLMDFLMVCSRELDEDQFKSLIAALAPGIFNPARGYQQQEKPDSVPQGEVIQPKKSASLNLSDQDLQEFQERLAPFYRAIEQLNRKLESGKLDVNAYDRDLTRCQQEIEKIRQEFEKRSKDD